MAQASAQEVEVVEGRCPYSDELAPLLQQNHVFVECDRLEILRAGGQVEWNFAFPARLRSIRFRGQFAQDGLFEVTALRLRSRRDWEEAEGKCEVEPSSDGNSVVTCLVRLGPRFFVVNFVADA